MWVKKERIERLEEEQKALKEFSFKLLHKIQDLCPHKEYETTEWGEFKCKVCGAFAYSQYYNVTPIKGETTTGYKLTRKKFKGI